MPNPITLSFCWSFADLQPEEGLARLRDHGFEAIELWPRFLEAFGPERWAEALAAAGMRCVQLCPYFDFMKGAASLEESRAQLESFLAAAAILDCRRLRVFTGPPWGEGVVGAREATELQWRDAIDGLREFCARAAAQGVELCLECHEGSLMEDSTSALRLIEAVARPNLTTNLQLPLSEEAWEVSLERLAPYTTHIHIHNWTRAIGVGDLTFLDTGAFDWKPVVDRILREPNRTLCLSVEHPNHGGRDDPWETARRDGAYLRELKKEY